MATKITSRVIAPGAVTANSIAEGISLGGGGGVTIDQIIITDANFANTEETEILTSGGYLKLYGSGFEANANVYISSTFIAGTQVTANVVSDNEIRLTIGSTVASTYNLFLINRNGSTATKLSSFVSILVATAGWFAGAQSPGSLIDRITFATDTATATVRGGFSRTTTPGVSGTGNFSFGWFAGGPQTSQIDRITFATDTATASARGSLSAQRNLHATVSDNSSFGWFVGGQPGPSLFNSTVDRITFANDNTAASIRGPLSNDRIWAAGVDNSNFGWIAGGRLWPNPLSSIERITFATDTSTTTRRAQLNAAVSRPAGTGNNDYGWFGGGAAPSQVTRVERITFANDNVTATVRGPLSLAKFSLAATGNDKFGWFAGGAPGPFSSVDRITFATDTATASARGPLSSARYDLGATSGTA
jgi:hypothetical protein